MRERTGSISFRMGAWRARVRYIDPKTGKRRELCRKASSKTDARDILDSLLRELEATGNRSGEHEHATFGEFAHFYLEHYVTDPEYAHGHRVAGLKSADSVRSHVRTLVARFELRRLASITYTDLKDLRLTRLKTPIVMRPLKKGGEKRERQRSIANVNRLMTVARRMFNVARRDGWVSRNPFDEGESLISQSQEVNRERVLGRDEEELLLAACDTPERRHLRLKIILAVDTGMRDGELRSLDWNDVDLNAGVISLRASNTKTERAREVPMTDRVRAELEALPHRTGDVLRVKETKRAFATACRIAKMTNFRFHDLRHTFTTRLLQGGMSLVEAMRLTGHTTFQQAWRYANMDRTTLGKAVEILRGNVPAETTVVDNVN